MARFSTSSSVRRNIQPSASEQSLGTCSTTRFRKTTMEDREVESMMVLLGQLRVFSVSLTFVCGTADPGVC